MTGRIIDFYKETGRPRPQTTLDSLISVIYTAEIGVLKKDSLTLTL
ncbi:hypothetical protein [Pelistega sp. MC2]|nr:hypothetical protein [Pelistega sp. MC2]